MAAVTGRFLHFLFIVFYVTVAILYDGSQIFSR